MEESRGGDGSEANHGFGQCEGRRLKSGWGWGDSDRRGITFVSQDGFYSGWRRGGFFFSGHEANGLARWRLRCIAGDRCVHDTTWALFWWTMTLLKKGTPPVVFLRELQTAGKLSAEETGIQH